MAPSTSTVRPLQIQAPKTLDEAHELLGHIEAELTILRDQIANPVRLDVQGVPLSPEEHIIWRSRATGAMRHLLRERSTVNRWISDYKRDVAQENRQERQRLHEVELRQAQERGRLKMLKRAKLLSDEEIVPDDDANLLRHAYRLLRTLKSRVTYSKQEMALIAVIQERVKIRELPEEDTAR